ncbi:MAG TPA: hypothetical protein VFG79_22410, partial [Solirubrobacter sp.]|nr:hypothetical protein [Solirubrobacter sp.]
SLLGATIIHEDRFKWDYPPTWVWALVYAGVPLAIPVLVARQRRTAEAAAPRDPGLRALRVVSGIAGAVLLIGATALYLAPVDLGKHWPWELTPLLARAVAAWYALFGTLLVTHAAALRRPEELTIGYATLACWSVLLLALPLLYPDDVSGAAVYVLGMAALLALALGALVAVRRAPRA